MKLKYDELLSNMAFNCNLRHYTKVKQSVRLSKDILLGRA